jgi:hypothetical protein
MASAVSPQPETVTSYLRNWVDRLLDTDPMTEYAFPNAAWKAIRSITHRVSQRKWTAFLVGGVLRDLVLTGGTKAPRDVDVVVCDVLLNELISELQDLSPARRTSLGGLRLSHHDVTFDIWPLKQTYAVRRKSSPTIRDVAEHAFLNVEAIAVELHPAERMERRIVESGFTWAVLNRTLEVNHESNPFPEVCAVKSLRTAINLNLFIGRSLLEYVRRRRWDVNLLIEAQRTHYGEITFDKSQLENILEVMSRWDTDKGRLNLNDLLNLSSSAARSATDSLKPPPRTEINKS